MTKEEFEIPKNLIKIAEVKGTRAERKLKKSRREIDRILFEGCLTIQGKLAMLEAFETYAAGDQKMVKRVLAMYRKICRDLGVEMPS